MSKLSKEELANKMTCKEFIRRFGTENDMCVYETEFYGKIDPLSETAEGAEYGINCGRGLSLQEMRAQAEEIIMISDPDNLGVFY